MPSDGPGWLSQPKGGGLCTVPRHSEQPSATGTQQLRSSREKQGEGVEGKLKDVGALGVPGARGDLVRGRASLKALPGLILCPQLVLYWTGGAEGGDALQVLRHMGSMGTCPWETPLIRSPNLQRAEASPERRARGSSPSSGTSSVTGDGTWHCHVHPQLGSRCWRGRSSPFPELRDVA